MRYPGIIRLYGAIGMEEKEKVLVGLVIIGGYCGRSPKIIRKLVKENNFPAVKIFGRWESNTDLIDVWQHNLVAKSCEESTS